VENYANWNRPQIPALTLPPSSSAHAPTVQRAFGAATAMLLGHSLAVAAQDVAHSFSELRGVVRPDAPITLMDRLFPKEGKAR
jgi:hypothetical protein